MNSFNKAEQHFKRGMEEFRSSKFESAKGAFEQALIEMPQHCDAALYLGICYYEQGDWAKAVENMEQAKEKYLQYYDLRSDMDMKVFEDAQDDIKQLEEELRSLGSDSASNRQRIGELQKQIGSLRGIKRPPAREPIVPARFYFHAGNAYLKLKKYNEAYAEFSKAVEIEPEHGEAHNNLAYLYFMAKQYEKSWEHMQLAKQYGAQVNPQAEEMLKKELGK